eukprot:scaffold84915_cov32-Prasinocladus_malaysianus.AAC.1
MQIKPVRELINTGGLFASIPLTETGRGYLTPEEFHEALLAARQDNDNALVLDCRNHKEVMIGRFDGALDPNTRSWAEWPSYAADL